MASAARSPRGSGIASAVGVGLAAVYSYGTARYRRSAKPGYELDEPPGPGTAEFARLVEGGHRRAVRPGNRVRVLRNGGRPSPPCWTPSPAARATVDFSSYIYWPGDITDRFTEALRRAARAGVEVNVVLDGYGSAKLDERTVERLERARGARRLLPPACAGTLTS